MIPRISVAAFILLTSCAARSQYVARRPVVEYARVMTSVKPEVPETKAVGESMMERLYLQNYPGFVATEDFTVPKVSKLIASPPSFLKGTRWRCMQQISAEDYVCSAIPSNRPIAPGKQNHELAINKSGEVIGIFEESFGDLVKFGNVVGKLRQIDVPSGKSYKQVWIFFGSSDSIVRISYREYRNEFATPVSIEDLTFDISSSREIAFRDLRIEIMLVTESTINYLVKK